MSTSTSSDADPPCVATVRTVAFDRLSREELAAWHRLRARNPLLDSPYFHPEFSAAVHASGFPVRVVVGRDGGGGVCALLPCERHGALLRPVGWPAADFQGPIVAPGTPFPPRLLLAGGVRGYAFDHLLTTCVDFDPYVESRRVSPFVDITGGLDAYLGRASRSGRDNMGQARRRAAKAERLHGPVRLVARSVDGAELEQVIELKRAQYASTGVRDVLADPARRDLLASLLGRSDPDFCGMLSTLHAGPRLLAAHFGIRSGNVLHWWLPVYDPSLASLSPGWILLRELVAAGPALGITRIDLGRGEDEYKRRAKTGETSVAQGLVTRSFMRKTIRRARTSLAETARSSALGPGLRRVARALRSMDNARDRAGGADGDARMRAVRGQEGTG